jgi:hypothetical protein
MGEESEEGPQQRERREKSQARRILKMRTHNRLVSREQGRPRMLDDFQSLSVSLAALLTAGSAVFGVNSWQRERRFVVRADAILSVLRSSQAVKDLVYRADARRYSLGAVGALEESFRKSHLRDGVKYRWTSDQ